MSPQSAITISFFINAQLLFNLLISMFSFNFMSFSLFPKNDSILWKQTSWYNFTRKMSANFVSKIAVVIWNQLFFSYKSFLYFAAKIQIFGFVIRSNKLFRKCVIEFICQQSYQLEWFPVLFSFTEKCFNFMKASKAS